MTHGNNLPKETITTGGLHMEDYLHTLFSYRQLFINYYILISININCREFKWALINFL